MGNLDAVRDWGYAPEYVEGMWRMLQADEPDDFVLATGGDFTVRDFVVTAFEHAGLDWEKHVRFDERYLRPTEVDALVGDAGKAQREARLEGDRGHRAAGPDHGRRRHRRARVRGVAVDRPAGTCLAGRWGRRERSFRPARSTATAPIYVAGHRGMVGSRGWRQLEAAVHRPPRPAARPSSTCATAARVRRLRRHPAAIRRDGGGEGRRHPGQLDLSRPSSSPTTCGSSSTSSTRPASTVSNGCSSSARPASTRSSRRSRSARTHCSPARSSRPTTPTPSPRSPASCRCRRSAASTGCATSPRCPPTSTARTTTSTSSPRTCCRR